jgi:hypothetical protein
VPEAVGGGLPLPVDTVPEAAGPEAAGPEAAGPEAAGPEAAGPEAAGDPDRVWALVSPGVDESFGSVVDAPFEPAPP